MTPGDIAVILGNLTEEERTRFFAAHLTYSAETGKGRRDCAVNKLDPYIVTSLSNLVPALHVLGWRRTRMRYSGGNQITIRRRKRCEDAQPSTTSPKRKAAA